MKFETIQNTPIILNFQDLVNDRGWELLGDKAIHYACNTNDLLKLVTFNIEPNVDYKISFKILAASESPNLAVGFDTPLYNYTTPQDVTLTLNASTSGKKISFWGSGYLEVRFLTVQKEIEQETNDSKNTITWSENSNRWVSFRSYRPEKGFSMFTDMFTCKDGQLFVHKEGNVRNSFYGNQFQTKIKFPISSVGVKTYQSIAIHSDGMIVTVLNGIETELGHVSDLIEQDFIEKENIYYANFLRDKLTDIINGDRLKGRFIVMEFITVDGSKKLQLFKIVSKSQLSTPNE